MKDKENNKKNGWNPNDISNIEEYFKNILDNFLNSDLNEKIIDQNIKKSSFSYKFGTGMDKPEISLNGKQIDEEILKKMMGKSLPFYLGQRNEKFIDQIDAEHILSPENSSEMTTPYENPFYEIYEDENIIEVTIELPSVPKSNININYLTNGVIINGVTEDGEMFQKTIKMKFQPIPEKTEINGKNGIFQITFKI